MRDDDLAARLAVEVGGVRSARDRGQRRLELWCNNSIYGLFLPL
jgi:hypothetical protein